MMSRSAKVIALCLGIAALMVAVGRYQKHPAESLGKGQHEEATARQPTYRFPDGIDPVVMLPRAELSVKRVYAQRFNASHNYLAFARATIEAARSGDSDAQYYLGKALRTCDESRAAFRFNSGDIGLEEALRRYSWGRNSARRLEAIYERCHDLEAADRGDLFGAPEEWIRSASDQGQPVAQTDEALTGFAAMQRSALTGQPADLNAVTGSGADPRSLLLAAVQTKDPEALFNVGQAQGFLNNFGRESIKNELAWWLVACQRGLPCDSDSEFQRNISLNDELLERLSGADFICAMAADDCQDVERRAQEINDKLNANAWGELNLQS